MENNLRSQGINRNGKSVRFPELARFGRASNAFWRVGCRLMSRWPSRWISTAGRPAQKRRVARPVSRAGQRPLHHLEPNLDVAAGGVGIGANLVRFFHQSICLGMREAGKGDRKVNVEAKTTGRARSDADRRGPDASAGTFGPPCEATNFIAPMKQAAYPAAKSCSGLLPAPPPPPSSFGVASLTFNVPSSVAAWPSRPPVALALVL